MKDEKPMEQLRRENEALRAEHDAACRAVQDERVRANRAIAAARFESEQQLAIAQATKATAHNFISVRFP